MKLHIECFPCMLRQTVMTLDRINVSDSKMSDALIMDCMLNVSNIISLADPNKTPAHVTTFLYRKIIEYAGIDPYKNVKHHYNELAMGLIPELMAQVQSSPDPLWTLCRIAIAGNIIDFGLFKEFDIGSVIKRSLELEIAVDEYARLKEEININDKILYLLDNAGEIVFDMMLIKHLIGMGKDVTVIVKGSPIINDVTIKDAKQIGLVDICKVIDNGSDAVGTILEWCSPTFVDVYNNATLIISKGQGNFETLHDEKKNIFFLFQAKCDVISRWLGIPIGSMLIKIL